MSLQDSRSIVNATGTKNFGTFCLRLTAAIGLAGTSASAVTVPYTKASIYSVNPNETLNPIDQHSNPAGLSSLTYNQSGSWGSVSALASADISTGELKIRATNLPEDGTFPYIQTNALFGDGFRTSAPTGPFAWTPQSTCRFTLDLTDSVVTSSGSLGDMNAGAFVIFSLFQPGTFDPSSKLVGGVNNIDYYLYLLGNPNQHLYYTDPQGVTQELIPTGGYVDLSNDIHIEQDFQPGGDFDWMVLLGASGQVGGPQFFDIDLSNTLTMNYAGPAGSITDSVSGMFQNYVSIPEPSSAMLIGVCALGLRRSRRSN